jgi:hypothetical protein
MEIHVLPVESLVYVTSYSPLRGLRGTIRTVHTIAPDLDEPFCFYLIALEGARVREPVWFEYDEVELIAATSDVLESESKCTICCTCFILTCLKACASLVLLQVHRRFFGAVVATTGTRLLSGEKPD